MTIRGISFYSELLIVGEVEGINRFPDSEHLI
jgi:hypothetical protein